MDAITVGNVIRQFRSKKGLSQEVLSGLADINRRYLSRVELGKSIPSVIVLYRLADALGIKASDLMKAMEKELE